MAKEKKKVTGRHDNIIRKRDDSIRGKVDSLRERER